MDISFGKYLDELLQKYGIKKTTLAKVLGVSKQHVSSITGDKVLPSNETYDRISDYLERYLTPYEDSRLSDKIIYAKTGLDTSDKGENKSRTVIENHFLNLFNQQTVAQQQELLSTMLQNINDNQTQMAKNAYLEEERAHYGASSSMVSGDKTIPNKGGKSKS